MKLREKQQARKLRVQGMSINEIARKLEVSKSSVSIWVRDIELTAKQLKTLSSKGQEKEAIERRRLSRLENESAKREKIIQLASKKVNKIDKEELFLIGVMLYWAEGGKTVRSLVRFSNADPDMIRVMMRFFREICKVSEEKFRGYIHIHPHLDAEKAERYWSSVSDIPLKQFYKTYKKPNKSSKNKKDSLPYGVFDIYITNTELFLKIKGWSRGIVANILD